MNTNRLTALYRTALGVEPFPYQLKFGCERIRDRSLTVPTGTGKTATAVLTWIFQSEENPEQTPRRLIYCLPMRTLVEQTVRSVKQWLCRLGLQERYSLAQLMGGQADDSWDLQAESRSILVGTQDMLLSRALNRGYGMSRYRWPLHFALLNNDCLWVFDEIQLLGAGLPTSTQLAAFRREFGCFGPQATFWLSATQTPEDLKSIDFRRYAPQQDQDDPLEGEELVRRLKAVKRVARAPRECRTPDGLAALALREHRPGTLTLVVVNRVERAREVYRQLETSAGQTTGKPDLLLAHSRFRLREREGWSVRLTSDCGEHGRIVVATQVIEAGVDLSAALLITDLAPYASMVQRFGRLNRRGEFDEARAFWVDWGLTTKQAKLAETGELDEKQRREVSRPYELEEIEEARLVIEGLTSAAPSDLPRPKPQRERWDVLRRRDLLDLFDTSRDLSGFDVDVSRFIRGGDEQDLSVAWRELRGEKPPARTPTLSREELCSIPVYELRGYLKNSPKGKPPRRAWMWDSVEGEWVPVDSSNESEVLRPGLELIVDCAAGGYDVNIGWDSSSARHVPQVAFDSAADEELDEDRLSKRTYRQTIEAHSLEVREELVRLLAGLGDLPLNGFVPDLLEAALKHDCGKAHPVFQETMHGNEVDSGLLLAKSDREGRHSRRGFRHEVASALAMLATNSSGLAAYLAAAHHGKLRVALRAGPNEKRPPEVEVKFARGVWDGDKLPPVRLGSITLPELTLDLEPMLLGRSDSGAQSWAERVLRLRDEYGPFRLAFLEALVKIADERASANPKDVLQ